MVNFLKRKSHDDIHTFKKNQSGYNVENGLTVTWEVRRSVGVGVPTRKVAVVRTGIIPMGIGTTRRVQGQFRRPNQQDLVID